MFVLRMNWLYKTCSSWDASCHCQICCMHVCSWFVHVRWMFLDFLDLSWLWLGFGRSGKHEENVENLPPLPEHLSSDGKEMVCLGKPGNTLAVGKLFQMAMWLISTSFLQLESILGQELHPGNQAFKCRLRRKEIACMPFGLFLLKIAHTDGNWCPASANCTFSQRWGDC